MISKVWYMDIFSVIWFVKDNTEIIWQITKYFRLEGKFCITVQESRIDSSFLNANQVSNHPKEINFVVKLKWLHTIFPKLIRDRCTSGVISSILSNGNVSISLDQCYPKLNLNITLLNLWSDLVTFFFFSFCGGW